MPVYDFRCSFCGTYKDIKLSMAEYDKEKTNQTCDECSCVMERTISKPVVQFKGNGWFDQGYGITEMESGANLDIEKRMEGEAKEMQLKDKKNHEEF